MRVPPHSGCSPVILPFSGTTRTAGYVLAIIGGLIVVQVLFEAAGVHVSLIPFIGDRLILWPGPLEIFSGRWMLIDV